MDAAVRVPGGAVAEDTGEDGRAGPASKGR